MKKIPNVISIGLTIIGLAADVRAQARPRDLAQTTLEELMQIEITSAARKEQRADTVPAAVFVLTHDDIRRSGLRTVPELLRLVPGVQVGQVNSSRVAVSVRGFNHLYANKLLVLIDGRSIYNRAFSGVFWEAQDLLVDDIERIEVIRGPGGASWGANAVNGVINIVTKSATHTQGLLARAGLGTAAARQAAVRYGGTVGSVAFRASSQWMQPGESLLPNGLRADDNAASLANGFRADWARDRNAFMLEGSFLTNETRPHWLTKLSPEPGPALDLGFTSSTRDMSILARWTHTQTNGASLQVQSFVSRHDADLAQNHELDRVNDIDIQYHAKAGARHDLVLGGGFRQGHVDVDRSYMYELKPRRSPGRVSSAFVQDEISLGGKVRVTVGSKVEHELVTGWSVQPTARAIWDVVPGQQHLWGAVSRAIRTPSAADLSIRVNLSSMPGPNGLPLVVGLVGNPDYHPEELVDVEAGYRIAFGSRATFDVSAFHGGYHHLQTTEPTAPIFEATPGPAHLFIPARFANLLNVDTTGVEVAGHLAPVGRWRVDGSYSALRLVPHPDPSSRDPRSSIFDGSAPRHQWQVQSTLRTGNRVELGGGLFHSGRLRNFAIPAYTRVDARISIGLRPKLTAEVAAKNLFDRAHREFTDISVLPTLAARRVELQLVWRP